MVARLKRQLLCKATTATRVKAVRNFSFLYAQPARETSRDELRRDASRPFWQHAARATATATSCIAGVAEQYIALAATETHSFSFSFSFSFFALAVGCGAARQKLTEKLSLLFFSIVFFFTFYLRAARARVWKMSENCADNKKRRLWAAGGKWQVAMTAGWTKLDAISLTAEYAKEKRRKSC